MNNLTLSFIFLIISSSFLFSQREDLPESNRDNTLDLKVTYQEYTVTNQYGGSKKGKYLNLRVNDLYFPNGSTGINKKNFDKYLKDCPQALDLGLDGLDLYDQSKKYSKFGRWAMWGGFGAAAVVGLRSFGDNLDEDATRNGLITALGLAGAGLTATWILNSKSSKITKKANEKVISAFDVYKSDCFTGGRKSAYVDSEDDSESSPVVSNNGESNADEGVRILVLSNNVDEGVLSIGAFGGIYALDAPKFSYGPHISYFKKGFSVHAEYGLMGSPGGDTDNQYRYSLFASLPVIKNKRLRKDLLHLGTVRGMEASSMVDLNTYLIFAIEGGMQYYQMFSDWTDSDYNVKARLLRGGFSIGAFNEASYTIDDNRFSDRVKYSLKNMKFYGNVLYNHMTEYSNVRTSFLDPDGPSHEDLGWNLGIFLKYGKRFKNIALYSRIEAGKYPINRGELTNIGFELAMGIEFYKIKR